MQVNNINLNTRIMGEGVPLIWAHGLMGSMAVEDSISSFKWDDLAQFARVIRYDARGHGQSEASYEAEDYHWASLAKDMIALADELKLNRFIAGGQSMGCMTSLYTGLTAPERTIGIVLVNPATAWETRTAQSTLFNQLADLVEAQGVRVLVDILKLQSLLPGWLIEARPGIIEAYLKAVQTFDAKVLAQVLRGAKLCDLPAREDLKKIGVPALILAWVEDRTHPLETAEEIDALLPQSQLVIAKDGNDLAVWPQMIRDFVKKFS
jgi:3-oxoadipate enol-lactonase